MKIIVKNIYDYSQIFYQESYNQLNNYQKTKINKLARPQDKLLSLLGIILVAKELNIPLAQIHYHHHKPYTNQPPYFSISHKYPYVAIALSTSPIGIDIELLTCLPKSTIKYLHATNSQETLINWTKKESLFKSSLTNPHKYHTIIIDNKIILTTCE